MNVIRRDFLRTSCAVAVGGVVACARQPASRDSSKILFAVEPTFIPLVGSDMLFQVRRIYCVGHNYAGHVREMGGDPTRESPFFFQKSTDAVQLVLPGVTIDHPYPTMTKNYHHEVELVAAVGKRGRNISADHALEHVIGYAVGLEMTRRDLQKTMGDMKRPWEVGKAFDHAAVVSHLHPAERVGHRTKGPIWLKVNGQTRQSADLQMMIWAINEQIANLSQYYELFPGDIIYSGTPENVGPVVPGDVMDAHIDSLYDIRVKIVS